MEFPTLYKLDSKNNVRIWKITVEDNGSSAYIFTESGMLNGKIRKTEPTIVTKGKNQGKINETSYLEQAINDATSKFNKKKRSDQLTEKMPLTTQKNTNKVFRPMLANKYDPKNVSFPYVLQPKLDGVRCNVHFKSGVPTLFSRTGKEFYNLQDIRNSLQKKPYSDSIILDGEIGCFGKDPELSFQEATGLIKRKKTSEKALEENFLDYVLYDIYVKDQPNLSFENRWGILVDFHNKLDNESKKHIKLCCGTKLVYAKDKKTIDKTLEHYLDKGFEGLMLRKPEDPYGVDKRPKGLLKYKKFQDAEFEIVGFKSGKGQDANTIIFTCKTKDNKLFDVRPKGTLEVRKEMLLNGKSYINKNLTVKFFELTDRGVPRFPVGISLRDYE